MSGSLAHWLAMGGYAAYVWPAYGIAALILGVLAFASLQAARAARRDLDRLQQTSPRGRG